MAGRMVLKVEGKVSEQNPDIKAQSVKILRNRMSSAWTVSPADKFA